MKDDIPKDLWLKAKASAMVKGKKIAEWLTEAIQEKLDREKADKAT